MDAVLGPGGRRFYCLLRERNRKQLDFGLWPALESRRGEGPEMSEHPVLVAGGAGRLNDGRFVDWFRQRHAI